MNALDKSAEGTKAMEKDKSATGKRKKTNPNAASTKLADSGMKVLYTSARKHKHPTTLSSPETGCETAGSDIIQPPLKNEDMGLFCHDESRR